jgi:hypothetical protein
MENVVIMLTGMILVLMGAVVWLSYKVTTLLKEFKALVTDCEIIVEHVEMCERNIQTITQVVMENEVDDMKNKLFYHGPIGEA